MKIPRLLLAGTSSGVGKTSITCSIIYGLKKMGYSVQPFKVGPDYIDPIYLSAISGNKAFNLDSWLMGKTQILNTFISNSISDISIIEGVMGFYDGFDGNSNSASSYEIASITKTPVLLVLDASKSARSIAATALGFQKFEKNSCIAGIILNKIGSKKHEILCKQALEKIPIPIVGIIPRDNNLSLESRHLGLVSTKEQKFLKNQITELSKTISKNLDFEKIKKIIFRTNSVNRIPSDYKKKSIVTIAIALDSSFNFYYEDNFKALVREGAKLKFFSPIKDNKIPKCDGIYIGGGFPEILASSLSKNNYIKTQIKKFSQDEMPIYAECGGLMYLTKSISSGNSKKNMVNIFDAETIMTRKMKLNYTKGKILNSNIISKQSKNFHGHEFHYSELTNISRDSKFAYSLEIGDGIKNHKDGMMIYNTLASYGHLYFDSSNFARNFVNSCIKHSRT